MNVPTRPALWGLVARGEPFCMPGQGDQLVDAATLLTEACDRNVPLELHLVDALTSEPVARGRMLDLTDDRVFIEMPQTIGRAVRLRQTCEYVGYFELGDCLFCFRTTVLEIGCAVRLNRLKQANGVALARPDAVQLGQRRQAFRTSLASADPIQAWAHESQPGLDDQVEIKSRRSRARVIDASAGGVCLLVEQPGLKLTVFDQVFVSFDIPEDGRLLCFKAEVRQVRSIHEGRAFRIGLVFLPWPDQSQFNRMHEPLVRYLAGVQRAARRVA